MPDFNPSLIALLGISYGGHISANYVESKSSSKARKVGVPEIKDLFCSEDGTFNLPKFQLFGFTIIANAIYIFNLFEGNVLEGLPDIPQSLHTLLLTSQGGYVGGKYVTEVLEKKEPSPEKSQGSESVKEEVVEKTESTIKKGKKK